MTEREKFEKFCDGFNLSRSKSDADKYADRVTLRMWETWQAATKAAVPQWIPVSERLPESEDINALIVVDGDVLDLVFNFSDDEYMGPAFSSVGGGEVYYGAQHVTHWMPLPAAPEVK